MPEIFEPTQQPDVLIGWISLLLAVVGAGGLLFTLRRPVSREEYNRKMLIAMLFFFLAMISAGTAIFSWLSARRTGPVTVYADAIETPYGKAMFRDIQRAHIVVDQPVGLFKVDTRQGAVKMLVIEERSGQAHVLSEQSYDIQRIFGLLQARSRRKEK